VLCTIHSTSTVKFENPIYSRHKKALKRASNTEGNFNNQQSDYIMAESKIQEEKWPEYNLIHSLKNTKKLKKVILVDKIRNTSTIDRMKLAALSGGDDFSADFSTIYREHVVSNTQDVFGVEKGNRNLSKYVECPKWSATTQNLQIMLYQLALHKKEMQSNNLVHKPFTLNISKKLAAVATASGNGIADYLKRRIDKQLYKELGYRPQYWFTIEYAPVGQHTAGQQRPHLHGSILLPTKDTQSIRKQRTAVSNAFNKAVGEVTPEFSRRVFNMGNFQHHAQNNNMPVLSSKFEWAGYCLKAQAFAKIISGNKASLFSDNETKKQAKAVLSDLSKIRDNHNNIADLSNLHPASATESSLINILSEPERDFGFYGSCEPLIEQMPNTSDKFEAPPKKMKTDKAGSW